MRPRSTCCEGNLGASDRHTRRQGLLRSPAAHFILIFLIATIVCFPLLVAGLPDGAADAGTHALYQYHFSRQFWNGELYPRWLAEHNDGYGSPVFWIQYPFPYFITALLRPVLWFAPTTTREAHELGIYCYLVILGAGSSAWIWFRYRYTRTASTIASIIYILLPFVVGQALYTRSAIGELTSFVWMPLMFALCDRIHPIRLPVFIATGVTFALLLLSNILNALIFLPLVVLYAAVSNRRSLLPMIFALGFGICIAAFYLLPFAAYMKYFDGTAFSTNHTSFELARHLAHLSWAQTQRHMAIPGILAGACLTVIALSQILTSSKGLDRLIMTLTLGLGLLMLIPGFGAKLIGLTGLTVTGFDTEPADAYSMKVLFTSLFMAGLGMLAYCRILEKTHRDLGRALLAASCAVFVLMLAWSAPLWKAIPQLSLIQFPWRLCALLTVTTAGLLAGAINDCLLSGANSDRKPSLFLIMSFAFAVIAGGSVVWRVDKPWRAFSARKIDITRQVDMPYVTYVPARNLVAFAKLIGTSPDSYDAAPIPVQQGAHATFVIGEGVVSVERDSPRRLRVSADTQTSARLRLSLLYFPLWKLAAAPESRNVETLEISPENLLEVSLPPGRHRFALVFDGGLPERVGKIVTGVSILLALGGLLLAASRAKRVARLRFIIRDRFRHRLAVPVAADTADTPRPCT